MKNLLRSIVFLVIGIMIFLGVQDVLTPDDIAGGTPGIVIDGFLDMKEPIDVLFLSNSHIQEGISPMQLYKNTGLVSYSMSCSVQPIEVSYYLLKQAFMSQSPTVVIYDPNTLYHKDTHNTNIAWRYVLDHLPINAIKLEMAMDYNDEWFSDGALSGFLPIIKYHTRWSELSKNDFVINVTQAYAAGEFPIAISLKGSLSMDQVDGLIDIAETQPNGYRTIYNGESIINIDEKDELYSVDISDAKLDYLLKMKELCDANGSELILMTIPVTTNPLWNSTHWSKARSDKIKEFAAEHDLKYIDIAYDYDIVDWENYSYDGGRHLNIKGAKKVTDLVGNYLLSIVDKPKENSNLYDEYLRRYELIYDIAMLQLEEDFCDYVDLLSERKNDYTIFISVCSDYTNGLTQSDFDLVEEKLQLGLFSKGEYCNAYAAVVDGGNVLYEEVSNRKIKHDLTVNDMLVSLCSSGYFTTPQASISVNGVQYAMGGSGINFVVWDRTTDMIVDSVSFETYQVSKPATRNWSKENTYLRAYESKIPLIEID